MPTTRACLLSFAFGLMAVLLAGCGPGLLALAGGSGGGIFAFAGNKKDKDGKTAPSTNSPPVVVINSLTREDAPASINYTLIDANSDLCSVQVTWSRDGINYFPCTQGVGGDPVTFLNSGPSGSAKVFKWDYEIDLLTTELETGLHIAIVANDGAGPGPIASLGGLVAGNDAPVVNQTTSPQSPDVLVTGSLVLVTFNIRDSSADVAGMVVAFTLDQGQTFTELSSGDYVGTPPTALLTTPLGAAGQFIWNSSVALPGFVGSDVYLALIPVDRPSGWTEFTVGDPVFVGPVTLNNVQNGPPELNLVSSIAGDSFVGTVPLQFTLSDGGSDSAEIAVEYTVDGTNWLPARLTGQATTQPAGPFVCSPNPRLYSLEWNGLADLAAQGAKSVELRLTPVEVGSSPTVYGTTVYSGTFSFADNEAPEVSDFEVYQNSGNISVRIQLKDSSSDEVSCAITATWNGGANSVVLSNADFVVGNLAQMNSGLSGEDNILIWNSNIALPLTNAADLIWEITPTDAPQGFPAAALPGPTFFSGSFSVINNPAAATPAGITLVEDNGRVTVNVSQTRNFTATILPAAAADHTVTWDIVEGGGNGSIVPVSSPLQGPQTALYTAPATLALSSPNFCTVRATSTVTGAVTATWRLYWGDAPTSVNVTPTPVDVVAGLTQQFTASVAPAGAPQQVNWSVVGGSANGTVTQGGLYTAPTSLPVVKQINVRATSVDGTVFGSAVVNLKPSPVSLLVTEAVGSSQGPSQVTLGQTLSLMATVNPPDAPQQVYWTIDWNGVNQGSGNSTVGFVNSSGLYTSPSALPSPSQVFVRARSQVVSSVTDDYQINLVAPPPTSFQVSPSTAIVTAGGAGVDFDAVNFVPANANQSVIWTINPVFGSIDSASGVYTPPSSAGAAQNVTVTATSSVAGTVTATAVVTVNPSTGTLPTSLTISPNTGRTFVQGRVLIFTANVLPSGAAQTVNWAVVSGGGTIDSSGRYTPPTTGQNDATVIIRATSTVVPSVFNTATINLDGMGNVSTFRGDISMARSEPSVAYDSSNNRVFVMGGLSETSHSTGKHDDLCFIYNPVGGTFTFLPRINAALPTNTISMVFDNPRKLLFAFLGNSTSNVGVYYLDTLATTPAWTALSPSGSGGNTPKLSQTYRYLCFHDEPSNEIRICVGDTIFRLDITTPASPAWLSRQTGVTGTPGAPQTEKCAYFYNSASAKHCLVGTYTSGTTATVVWQLNTAVSPWNWDAVTTLGTAPAGGLDDASAAFDAANNRLLVFGGRSPGGLFSNELRILDFNVAPPTWGLPSIALERTPDARGDAALIVAGTQLVMFGGRNLVGYFGDLWQSTTNTLNWLQPSPSGIVPQGRRNAACVWIESLDWGYVYGGICDHGVSDELWRVRFDAFGAGVLWEVVNPSSGAATLPGQLQGASLVFNGATNRIVLFGGNKAATGQSLLQNSVYQFNPTTRTWAQASTTGTPPTPRMGHAACFDESNDRMIVFGGYDNTASPYTGSIHYLNLAGAPTWVTPTVTGSIDGRAGAFCGISDDKSRMYVLGGATQAAQSGTLQLYEWVFTSVSAGTWTALATHAPSAPKGIFPGAGAFDPDGERFLTAPPAQFDNQALVFCNPAITPPAGTTWQSLTIGGAQHGLGACGMFDPASKRFYAIGGEYDLGAGKTRKLNQVRIVRFE